MNIFPDCPPNVIEEDKKIKNVITNYKGDIYLCGTKELRDDLIEHEKKHIEQQGDNHDAWLVRYQTDNDFMIDQEIEAYRVQLTFIEKTRGHADMLTATVSFAKFLSSEVYGNII